MGTSKEIVSRDADLCHGLCRSLFTEPFGVWISCKTVSHFLTRGIRLQAFGVQQSRVDIVRYIRSSFPSIASVEEPTGSIRSDTNCGGSFYNVTSGPFSRTEQ
jgi:hypothetical protein